MRRSRVHFDLRRHVRLGERLFESNLIVGRPRVVICRDGNEELRSALSRPAGVRAVGRIGHQSAAMECGDRSHPIGHRGRCTERHRTTDAIALRAHLPIPGHARLPVQPPDERFGIRHMGGLVQTLSQRPYLIDGSRAAGRRGRGLLDAVGRVYHQHRVSRFGKPFAHLGGTQDAVRRCPAISERRGLCRSPGARSSSPRSRPAWLRSHPIWSTVTALAARGSIMAMPAPNIRPNCFPPSSDHELRSLAGLPHSNPARTYSLLIAYACAAYYIHSFLTPLTPSRAPASRAFSGPTRVRGKKAASATLLVSPPTPWLFQFFQLNGNGLTLYSRNYENDKLALSARLIGPFRMAFRLHVALRIRCACLSREFARGGADAPSSGEFKPKAARPSTTGR
jgi:hypothetical protein